MAKTDKETTKTTAATKKPQDRKPKKMTTKEKSAPIDIAANRDEITINLVGETYNVKPPKGLVMLQFAQEIQGVDQKDPAKILDKLTQWIRSTFSEKDGDRIVERMFDSDDDLDLPHIMQLMEALIERATGNPSM